ncbi:MAG TPA: NfeD family protein [Geminicoccaceae bacterium]|nr:NfeD family protein [Geminicoccus sp.]HMU48869.1 NfeD family protein [Geminicoccaceae bacterium]
MSPWLWLTLGVVLAVIEVFAPGFFFLWLGIGAVLTAVIGWLAPSLSWQGQLLAFACLALLTVVGWFAWRRRMTGSAPMSRLNRRAAQQQGAEGPLVDALAGGRGRVRLGDTTWGVTGPDLPAGTLVKVIGVDDDRLVVERAGDRRPDA